MRERTAIFNARAGVFWPGAGRPSVQSFDGPQMSAISNTVGADLNFADAARASVCKARCSHLRMRNRCHECEPEDDALTRSGNGRFSCYMLDGRMAAAGKINPWLWALTTDIDFYGPADAFYFDSPEAARSKIDSRDGTVERRGWLRRLPSGRHRADGAASEEYVQP